MKDRLCSIEKLARADIPVSVRLQPIFYGHEKHAWRLVRDSAQAGAKHISAEYLKLAIESSSAQSNRLEAVFPGIRQVYAELGALKVGREYVLPAKLKLERLNDIRAIAERSGMSFGYAENEFLHLNKFKSCCNAADLYLNNYTLFDSSILGIIKKQRQLNEITFPHKLTSWTPSHSVFSHLNSRSRPEQNGNISDQYYDFCVQSGMPGSGGVGLAAIGEW